MRTGDSRLDSRDVKSIATGTLQQSHLNVSRSTSVVSLKAQAAHPHSLVSPPPFLRLSAMYVRSAISLSLSHS
jgi:hypothetical protein